MDSNTNTLSASGTLAEADEITTNDEIMKTRAEIEATRTDMAQTLEAIKDKLNPGDLMDQAKDRVTEMAGTLADKAKDTVHTMVEDVSIHAKDAVSGAVTGTVDSAKEAVGNVVHSAQDMVSGAVETAKGAGTTVLDTIKRNPIPSALAAFGAIWLYMRNRDDSPVARSAPYVPHTPPPGSTYNPQSGTSYVPPSMGDSSHLLDQDKVNEFDASLRARASADTKQEASMGVIDTIQRNPVPAAMAACAITWLYLKNKDDNKPFRSDDPELYPYDSRNPSQSNGSSHGIIDTVKETAEHAKDAAGNLVSTAKDKASHLTDAAKDKASHLADAAKDKASHLTEKAKEQAEAIGTKASKVSSSVSDSFNTSPIPIGMVALGVGMAVGLLVPESERENQWMGTTRDRLMDRAQDTAHDIAGKVQAVAQETFEAAKTTVQEQVKTQGLVAEEEHTPSGDDTLLDITPPWSQQQGQYAPADQMQDVSGTSSFSEEKKDSFADDKI